jgi:alpha-glucoside transport system substrate-binding protein
MRYRLAFIAVVAFLVAGCGGGGGGGKKSSSGGGASNVKGSVTMVAVWTGAEQDAFQAILNGFKSKYPNVKVRYQAQKDPASFLSTAVEGGNPPDLAALPAPGIIKGFVGRGLKPLDFAKSTIGANYAPGWLSAGTFNGKLYALFFKGANKSTVWYNVKAFKDAGVTAPKTWDDLSKDAKTLKASGVDAYSIGGSDGWTLTDLFENIYLRQAGPDMYDKLTKHEIKWTDPSVKQALTTMGQVIGDTSNIPGGTSQALQTDFPTSVTQVFTSPPKAAMVFEGDFVAGVITSSTKAKPKTDFDVFDFPQIGNSSTDAVLGGGDGVVMFKDSPAAEALIKYLSSPGAQEIWAKRGGYTAPNKNVDPSVYPDAITRAAAAGIAKSGFRFDMSDQMPASFGSDAEFSDLQNFLKNPKDVNGAAAKLEADASKAFK